MIYPGKSISELSRVDPSDVWSTRNVAKLVTFQSSAALRLRGVRPGELAMSRAVGVVLETPLQTRVLEFRRFVYSTLVQEVRFLMLQHNKKKVPRTSM